MFRFYVLIYFVFISFQYGLWKKTHSPVLTSDPFVYVCYYCYIGKINMHLGMFTGSSPLSGVLGVMAVVVYARRYNLKIIYSPDLGRVVSGQPARPSRPLRPLQPARRGQPSARQRGGMLTFGAGFTSLLSIIGWKSKFKRGCAQYRPPLPLPLLPPHQNAEVPNYTSHEQFNLLPHK